MTKATVVLLPGLDGTEIFFGPLLASLPSWISPVVVTYPTSGPNAYEDLVPLVERVLDSLGKCVILGWSFGGPLALMVAARRPSQISGVILCASFVTPPRPRLVPFRSAITQPVIATVRAIRRMRFLIASYGTPELREAKGRTWRRVKARVLAVRARAALGVDVSSLLANGQARVLYLASTRDETIPRTCLEEILAIEPRTLVSEIEGPHLALFTNPTQATMRIADFLRSDVLTCHGGLTSRPQNSAFGSVRNAVLGET